MDELNRVLLQIYDATQAYAATEFSERLFSLVKSLIPFDSAGFCDFKDFGNSGIRLMSAAAHNISAHDKLRARREYLDLELVKGQNALTSDDPLLVLAFKSKGTAVSLSLESKLLKPNLVAYGRKTEAMQTMTMVVPSHSQSGFQTLSLWRRKLELEYVRADHLKANILLPHVFNAFSINRRIHQASDADRSAAGTSICSMSGAIFFIDDVAVELLIGEFGNWNPPFLPDALLAVLRTTSQRMYIGKRFSVVARCQKDVLFLAFRKSVTMEKLSPTELVVAEMLVRNETYKAIAQKLGNQPATVRNQAHAIYTKFGVSGKAELAKAMQRQGGQ